MYDNLTGLTKDSLNRPEDRLDTLDRFFDSDIARMKFYKDSGFDPADALNRDVPFPSKKFKDWKAKEEDKYLSQDGVFQYFDEFEETTKTMPYTLDNVVENMIQETQRGGEGGLGMFGANRLRALMSERFESLADIKNRKEMLTKNDPPVNDLFDDVQRILEDVEPSYEIARNDAIDATENVLQNIGESLKAGEKDIESIVKNSLDFLEGSQLDKATSEIAMSLRLNAMRPVEYFEAKPMPRS